MTVYPSDMNKDDADPGPLIECTAGALDDELLERLFVSTQQTNLEICMIHAIESTLRKHLETTASEGYETMIGSLGSWFPHIQVRLLESSKVALIYFGPLLAGIVAYRPQDDVLRDDPYAVIRSKSPAVASGSSTLENIVQLISAAVIIFEHSSYIFNKQRYLEDKQESDPSFNVALEQYMSSPHAGAVMKGVSDTVHAYENAVATSAKENESSCSPAKAQLINAVIEITLNHRLHLNAMQRRWCSEVELRCLSSEAVGVDLQSRHAKISVTAFRMKKAHGRRHTICGYHPKQYAPSTPHFFPLLLPSRMQQTTRRGEVLRVDAGRANVGCLYPVDAGDYYVDCWCHGQACSLKELRNDLSRGAGGEGLGIGIAHMAGCRSR
ncbi:hypothetical protein EV424DRAFT_1545413 [Suillus variegatus]|nr:hypothetical protein EV424DRAFT_1545413 [Suillus variegatus]